MSKYEDVIIQARSLITDVHIKSINQSGLKISEYMAQLQKALNALEARVAQQKGSVRGKVKSVMFLDGQESAYDELAADVTEWMYRINTCLKCKCANCLDIDNSCGCEGCMYGAFVTECDKLVEQRGMDYGIGKYNGENIKHMSYDRVTRKTTLVTESGSGREHVIEVK